VSDIQQLEDRTAPLVRRAQAGDAEARDELLRSCQATIYRWAYVLTVDADDAEDIAQEVLIRVVTHLHRYAGRSRFTTWLYRVTRNTALSLRRRLASRLRLIGGLGATAEPPSPNDPLERLHETQTAAVVGILFRDLPARQREVFYLIDVEGYGAAEIAGHLGLSPVTVRAHLFRARRTLRAWILKRHPEIAEEYGR